MSEESERPRADASAPARRRPRLRPYVHAWLFATFLVAALGVIFSLDAKQAEAGNAPFKALLVAPVIALLVLPSLWNTTAYLAATSIAVIGLYVAYVAPVFLRRRNPDFRPGPWNLGKWSPLVGWIAIVWVIIICILFVLPTASPITATTFNYTIFAVLVVVGAATIPPVGP